MRVKQNIGPYPSLGAVRHVHIGIVPCHDALLAVSGRELVPQLRDSPQAYTDLSKVSLLQGLPILPSHKRHLPHLSQLPPFHCLGSPVQLWRGLFAGPEDAA